MTLLDNYKIINNDNETANIMNTIIVKYRNHPGIKAILNELFSFDIVDREKILKGISSLDHTKACQESDIPTKIIKENADTFSEVLHL